MSSPLEEYCKAQFQQFIQRFVELDSIIWDNGDEPPDYYVSIQGERFAVEVTTLMENIQIGEQRVPEATVIASLWRLVRSVDVEAKTRKILNGTYIVSFSRPIEDFGRHQSRIKKLILDYVGYTASFESASEQKYYIDGIPILGIRKVHDKSNKIAPIGPTSSKWESQAQQELCELISTRLHEKSYKLRKVSLPKILLLYDRYGFSEYGMHEQCISQLDLLPNFHTVFVIIRDEASLLLYSQAVNWSSQFAK